MKIFWVFFVSFTLFTCTLFGQDVFYSPKYSFLDSLIIRNDITTIGALLQNDSLAAHYLSIVPKSTQGISKSTYVSLLQKLSQIASLPSEDKSQYLKQVLKLEDQYFIQEAGGLANNFFDKFKNSYTDGNNDSALACFYIAQFFRNKYIVEGRDWFVSNADSISLLLHRAETELQIAQQSINSKSNFSSLDEADMRMKAYQDQNSQSPISQGMSAEVKNRYKSLLLDLEKFNHQRKNEQESTYRKINYMIGISCGGQIVINEPTPLYLNQASSWYPSYTYHFQDQTVVRYTISAYGLYFLKENISIEASYAYSRGVIKPNNTPYNHGDVYNFSPKDDRDITCSTISCIAQHYLRIKTGIRPFLGLGLEYSISHIAEVPAFQENYIIYSSASQQNKSIRIIARGGLEYLPSATSHFSYSVLMNISTRITSTTTSSLFNIEPAVRISWLIP